MLKIGFAELLLLAMHSNADFRIYYIYLAAIKARAETSEKMKPCAEMDWFTFVFLHCFPHTLLCITDWFGCETRACPANSRMNRHAVTCFPILLSNSSGGPKPTCHGLNKMNTELSNIKLMLHAFDNV